jgi:tRNA pseudouridine55 synthase
LLGVDYGTRRIGLAISDPDRKIAFPLATYEVQDESKNANFFRRLIADESAVEIIVGLPIHTDGREGIKAREARQFGQWLHTMTNLPVRFWDERFTTAHAESALWNAGLTHKKRRQRRDRVAAQMMLQAFLDAGCPSHEGAEPLKNDVEQSDSEHHIPLRPATTVEANGWLVIDKPLRMTSRAAVDWASRWFPNKTPIGHTGTLDPLATGVLVLAIGRATRLAEYVQQLDKVYESTFTLGAISATDDSEGPITATANAIDPGRDVVAATLQQFVGTIQQPPPAFSAVKIAGRRAYLSARRGDVVAPAAKSVTVHAIRLLDYCYPHLRVEVRCGKGTYIRSLARDFGAALGCGAYVSQLRRTSVGSFTTADATPLDAIQPNMLPLDRGVGGLIWETISAADVKHFRKGQTISAAEHLAIDAVVACFDDTGRLVAVARVLPNHRLQPVKVLWQWTDD